MILMTTPLTGYKHVHPLATVAVNSLGVQPKSRTGDLFSSYHSIQFLAVALRSRSVAMISCSMMTLCTCRILQD